MSFSPFSSGASGGSRPVDGEPDLAQFPAFRGPRPRPRPAPARRKAKAVAVRALTGFGDLIWEPRRPALRALVLLAAMSAGAVLGSTHLIAPAWRPLDPGALVARWRSPAPRATVPQPVPAHKASPPAKAAAPAAPAAASAAAPLLAAPAAMARGDALMKLGDVVAARGFYVLAAAAGRADAALALARSYDPDVLRQAGAVGLKGDPAQAARWYREAARLASPRRG